MRYDLDHDECDGCTRGPGFRIRSDGLLGQYGPVASIAGYGYHAAGMAGFYEVTGWPDMFPHGPWLAYTDVIAPHFIVASIVAALDHRRRTGRGQHIDAAQFEMAMQFLAPEILDAQANGYVATRMGNRKRDAAPYGIFPCAGQDQWCAIGVDTDEQWQALKTALGDPAWTADSALDTLHGRITHHDDIDAGLSEWTCNQAPSAVMDTLTSCGVPAGAVQRSRELAKDPQYLHRQFYRAFEHPVMGNVPYAGNQFRIPGYAGGPNAAAPLLGEHNQHVFGEILGLNEAEIATLIESGVVR